MVSVLDSGSSGPGSRQMFECLKGMAPSYLIELI